VAFSTHPDVRRTAARRGSVTAVSELPNDKVSPLFQAVVEATEEAVLNSLFKAETMEANGARIEALPVERVIELHQAARGRR
jgi:D-aminopeptidase